MYNQVSFVLYPELLLGMMNPEQFCTLMDEMKQGTK